MFDFSRQKSTFTIERYYFPYFLTRKFELYFPNLVKYKLKFFIDLKVKRWEEFFWSKKSKIPHFRPKS